jgi:hypothetical protein
VKNQYIGQIDTHNDDFRNIETDFNTPSFIKDPSNQDEWSDRVRELLASIELTRINVKTAINNK